MQQAVGNLVCNAIKFTPEGGEIAVGVNAGVDELVVSVRDAGVGIPTSDVANVFDRFWHRRRESKSRGNGLGLAITRGIVEAHGGRIWVESTPGSGTTFRFTVPLAETGAAVQTSTNSAETGARP